jgi:hypothetical protein
MNHYQWAGLDFMLDADGRPVLLEANRCSHMLKEYVTLYGDDEPLRLVAAWMRRRGRRACCGGAATPSRTPTRTPAGSPPA